MQTVNFNSYYRVEGYRGIAFYLLGYAKRFIPIYCYTIDEDGEEIEVESGEFEEEDDTDNVIAVMVGDDRKHTVSIDDITEIEESEFCHDCGQIGCGHNTIE